MRSFGVSSTRSRDDGDALAVTPAVEVIAGGIDHPEAVVWDATRGVVFCGGEAGQLYAVGLDGYARVVAETGGSLLGLALDAAGVLYACDTGRRAVVALDPDSGATTVVSRGAPDRPFIEPNGIAIGADGSLYVTCSGLWGADDGVIMRISCDGATAVWSAASRHFPNGCAIRGGSLLVVESSRARVVSFELTRPSVPHVVCRLSGCVPDQIAPDSTGRLFVGCYRPDLIAVVDREGVASDHVRDPTGMTLACPTGVAFAGPDLEILVASNFGAGDVVRVEVDERGAPVDRPWRPRPARL